MLCLNSLNKQYGLDWRLVFLLRLWNLCTCQTGRWWLYDEPPIKTLGTEPLINFTHMCSQHIIGWLTVFCRLHWGKSFGSFPLFSPRVYLWDFSFADCAWYSFTFIHWGEYDYIPPSKHLTWGWSLGLPEISVC